MFRPHRNTMVCLTSILVYTTVIEVIASSYKHIVNTKLFAQNLITLNTFQQYLVEKIRTFCEEICLFDFVFCMYDTSNSRRKSCQEI